MFRTINTAPWEENLAKDLATKEEITTTLGEKYVPESVHSGIEYNQGKINEFAHFNKYSSSLNAWLAELFEKCSFEDAETYSGLYGGWFGTVCRKDRLLIRITFDAAKTRVVIEAAELAKHPELMGHDPWFEDIIDRTKINDIWQETETKKKNSPEDKPFFEEPIHEATARHFGDMAMSTIDRYLSSVTR